MNNLKHRIKRIEELIPKPAREVKVIFKDAEETIEEAYARAGVNREDPDEDHIVISFVGPGKAG